MTSSEVTCYCSGFGLSAFFFFGLAFVENGIEAVVFLTVAVGLSGIAISGRSFHSLSCFNTLLFFPLSASVAHNSSLQ